MPTKTINTNKSNSKNTNNINIKIDLNDKPKRKRRTNKPKQPQQGVADPSMNYPVIPAVPAPPTTYNTYYPKQETTEPQGETTTPFDSLVSNRENQLNALRNKVVQEQQEQVAESLTSVGGSTTSQSDRMVEALPQQPLIENLNTTFTTPQANVYDTPSGFTSTFNNPLNDEIEELNRQHQQQLENQFNEMKDINERRLTSFSDRLVDEIQSLTPKPTGLSTAEIVRNTEKPKGLKKVKKLQQEGGPSLSPLQTRGQRRRATEENIST
jgi:hypothetical protein